ncbi:MAG: indole-3-glycerol phosphate synthase TrpC [Methanobacteriaceae archaeon]|nr:indole-3-glycerol phosphate synthase TrpC [Methanobacteriaceae archaeon]
MVTLNEILRKRKAHLERTQEEIQLNEVKHRAEREKPGVDLEQALEVNKDLNDLSVIGEYKPASPSRGHLSNFEVEEVVKAYQKGGTTATSVLTEEEFFKSSIENLKTANTNSSMPLIRKDFIMDEYQIYEARGAGASSLLLMVSIYPDLEGGISLSRDLGMEALVECSNREEVNLAKNSGARIIGINNRNFQDFSIDFKRTLKMAQHVPDDLLLVSESGVNGPQDLKLLADFGADAVLIGGSIMASNSIKNLSLSVKNLVDASKGVRMGR